MYVCLSVVPQGGTKTFTLKQALNSMYRDVNCEKCYIEHAGTPPAALQYIPANYVHSALSAASLCGQYPKTVSGTNLLRVVVIQTTL